MSDTSNEDQQPAAGGHGLTANDLLENARLQRARVRDDGSCWVYAVLASLFVLDHAPIISLEEEEEEEEDDALDTCTNDADAEASSGPKPRKRKRQVAAAAKKKKAKKKKAPDDGIGEPSERDRLLDNTIRSRLYEKQKHRFEDPESVLIVPQEDSMGSYGGYEHFSSLAVEFGVDIVVYDENDKKGLQNPSKEWLLLSRSGDWIHLAADQIQERMDDPNSQRVPVLHVAMSRDIKEHYEAYRYKGGWLDVTFSSYEFPSWFRELEENVAVSALEKREDSLYLKREQAVGTWRRAMEGDAEAMEALADMYQSGTHGLPRRVDLSREWREKVEDAVGIQRLEMLAQSAGSIPAEEEASEALYRLGYLYEHGLKGLAQSDEDAFTRYQQSAELQNAAGMAMAACFIMNGRGGAQRDKGQAFCMMSSAAEAGSDRACLEVGMWHLHGLDDLVPKDVVEAKTYLKMAIDISEGRQDGMPHMGEDGLQQAKSCVRSCGRAK